MRGLCVSLLVLVITTTVFAAGTGYLTGRVIDDATDDPIQGAKVVITELRKSKKSDGSGFYLFSQIPAGTYTVSFSCTGCKPMIKTQVIIRENGTTTVDAKMMRDPDAKLSPPVNPMSSSLFSVDSAAGGSITGRVRDVSSLVPLAEAEVVLEKKNRKVTTNFKGLYTLRFVPAGTYSIHFTCSGYQPKTINSIEVKAQRPVSVSVELEPFSMPNHQKQRYGNQRPVRTPVNEQAHTMKRMVRLDSIRQVDENSGIITGRVTDERSGRVIVRGYVGIEELKNGAKIDNGGYYMFSAPPGNYTVSCGSDSSYEEKRITGVKIRSGVTTTLDIQLTPVR